MDFNILPTLPLLRFSLTLHELGFDWCQITHRLDIRIRRGKNIFKRFNIPEERADFCERLTEIGAFTNRWALTNLESSQAQSIWGITRQYLADNDTNTRNRLFSHWFSVTWLCGLGGFQTSTKWDFEIHSNAYIYLVCSFSILFLVCKFSRALSMWDMRITGNLCTKYRAFNTRHGE